MVRQIPAGSGRSDSWWQAKRGEIIPLDPAAAAMEEIRKRVMKDAEEAFAREVLIRLRTWILSHTRLRPAETGLNINVTFQPAMTPPKPRNGDWMWMSADGESSGWTPAPWSWRASIASRFWLDLVWLTQTLGYRLFQGLEVMVLHGCKSGSLADRHPRLEERRGIDGASEHARRVRNHCIARSVHSISVLSRLYTTCQPERASERTNLIKGLSR